MKKEKKDDYSIFLCGGEEPEPIPGKSDYEAKLKAYMNLLNKVFGSAACRKTHFLCFFRFDAV